MATDTLLHDSPTENSTASRKPRGWQARWRELDARLPQAWENARNVLHRDWAMLTGSAAVRAVTTSSAYVEYGRLLGKLRRDPAPQIAAMERELDALQARDALQAHTELARVDTRILSTVTAGLTRTEDRLAGLRQRITALRASPEASLARLGVKSLAAALLLVAAAVLLAAEFSLAKEVTSTALGLEYAGDGGIEWQSPVSLFAFALCALTLPFKFLADKVHDSGSSRYQLAWLISLGVLALALVSVVGYLRGVESHKLANAAAVFQDAAASTRMPSSPAAAQPGTLPAGSPSPPAAALSQRWFAVVFIVAGLLFPLAGAAILSKARAPVAEIVNGVAARTSLVLAIPCQWIVIGWLWRRHARLASLTSARVRFVTRVGTHAGVAVFLQAVSHQVRARDPDAAHALDVACEDLAWNSSPDAINACKAALARANKAALTDERIFSVRHLTSAALHALDAATSPMSLDRVREHLALTIAEALRAGYANGLSTAAELLADSSAEDLYHLETLSRFHAEYFAGSNGPVPGGTT